MKNHGSTLPEIMKPGGCRPTIIVTNDPTVPSKISEIKVTEEPLNYFLVKGIDNKRAVHTPLTMRAKNKLHISIHEAGLFERYLVPTPNGTKATVKVPFRAP